MHIQLELLVSAWFQVLFHSPPGVLFTFPSRYLFTIGRIGYLALAGGPARFPRNSTCSAVLGMPLRLAKLFAYRSFTFYAPAFQLCSTKLANPISRSHNPNSACTVGLGYSPFARRYLGNRVFFLFFRVLRCFSSPTCPHMTMYSPYGDRSSLLPGCPIRISTVLRLFAATRGFSQLTTSFFGPMRLGIHHTPLLS